MVSLSRILTKLLLPDERAGTLIFFLVSAGLELLCFLLHLLVRGSRFVLYHTARPRHCRPSRRAGYRVHHDVAAEDVHFVSREVGGGHLGAPGTAATLSQPRSPSRCRLKLQLLLWPEALSHGPSFLTWTTVPSLGGTHVRGLSPLWV